MKTCPVCKSGAFDDAKVCYGCLHQFTEEDSRTDEQVRERAVAPAHEKKISPSTKVAAEKEFVIRIQFPEACVPNLVVA